MRRAASRHRFVSRANHRNAMILTPYVISRHIKCRATCHFQQLMYRAAAMKILIEMLPEYRAIGR